MIDYIDDALLWSYTVNKPKQIDFINKINEINEECNKLFDKYKNDINNQNSDLDKLEELEKICYSLKSSIMCGLYSFKKDHLNIINEKIDFYFSEIAEFRLEEYKLEKYDEKLKIKKEFYEKCETYINEINNICSNIESELIINDIGINTNLVNELSNSNNDEGTNIDELFKN